MGLKRISPDGNCLFRSIAHQLYGDADRFREVRKRILDYMASQKARFEPSFQSMEAHDPNFDAYLERMRKPGQWGGAVEILAAEEVFDRYVCVMCVVYVHCCCYN